jgi:hypothetical protein
LAWGQAEVPSGHPVDLGPGPLPVW